MRLFTLAALVLLTGLAPLAQAAQKWEVAVLFTAADEEVAYQEEMDTNLRELSQVTVGPSLSLSLYREFPSQSVFFSPGAGAPVAINPIFHSFPIANFKVPGTLRTFRVTETILRRPDVLASVMKSAFRDPTARRILVMYTHGEGPDGVRPRKSGELISLQGLREALAAALPARQADEPALDVLWLDSCYMAAIEVGYEVRSLARFLVASEDAEFSAGMPFDILGGLASEADFTVEEAAETLAQRFVESYSYTRRGYQRTDVETSAATVSVIDTSKLATFTEAFVPFVEQFRSGVEAMRASLARNLPSRRMENGRLVDLGGLLDVVSRQTTQPASVSAKQFLRALELSTRESRATNPRVAAVAPKSGALLVFGYGNWEHGDEADAATLARLPPNQRPTTYVQGPNGKRWPARPVNKRLYLTPFTVGQDEFRYFFVDPTTFKPIAEETVVVRGRDYFYMDARTEANPVRFRAYTQSVGKASERYTGISILDPLTGAPGFEYMDTEFAQKTGWSSF